MPAGARSAPLCWDRCLLFPQGPRAFQCPRWIRGGVLHSCGAKPPGSLRTPHFWRSASQVLLLRVSGSRPQKPPPLQHSAVQEGNATQEGNPPPPGKMPSSMAAQVALRAPSTRAFRFLLVSDDPLFQVQLQRDGPDQRNPDRWSLRFNSLKRMLFAYKFHPDNCVVLWGADL